MTRGVMVSAYDFNTCFHGFGAGITEKHRIGEAVGHQPFGKPLLARNRVEIGAMPKLTRLFLKRGDEMGMGMAEAGDADAAGKIQIALAIPSKKIGPFPVLKSQIRRVVCGQDGRNHVILQKK
jgi:hypothetical protein